MDTDAPFQLQVTNLDYSDYLGRLALGHVKRGTLKKNDSVVRIARDGSQIRSRVTKLYTHMGLARVEVEEVSAGDIIALRVWTRCRLAIRSPTPTRPTRCPS